MERLESKQKECQLLCEIHDIVTASMHSNMEHQQQQLQERNLFGLQPVAIEEKVKKKKCTKLRNWKASYAK